MQTENWTLKKYFSQPTAKWIAIATMLFLIGSTSLFLGAKTQYVLKHDYKPTVQCFFSINCSPNQRQISEHSWEEDVEPFNPEVTNLPVKPSGGGIIAGGISAAVLAGLVALQIVALPVELILAIGAVIGSGSYLALKAFY